MTNPTPLISDSNRLKSQGAAQILSIAIFIAVIVFSLAAYYYIKRPFWVAISAGALGGLVHEMVQSGGKYVLPNTDENGDFMLGGLVGLLAGGIAGVLTYEALLGTTPIPFPAIAVTAFLAGAAVKGIADAANPPKK